MKRAALAVFALAAALTAAAQGPGPSVTMSVHPPAPIANRPFDIVITIKGTNVTSIRMPEAQGVEIAGSPHKQSTQMRLGEVTLQRAYSARIARPGRYTLPPVEVIADGRAYASEPVNLNVVEDIEPSSPQAGRPGSGGGQQPRRSITVEEAAFLKAYVDKSIVYQGEAILLTLELWTVEEAGVVVTNIRNVPMTEPPLTGFYVIPAPSERNVAREIDGIRYEVATSRRWLFPTGAGEFPIDSWQWHGNVQERLSFGRGVTVSPKSSPFTINVKPLPPRPAGFSGAVGAFDIAASVSTTAPTVGEPAVLTYTVSGQGNPEAVVAPVLPAIDGVHLTGPATHDESQPQGDAIGVVKRFEYTLIPTREGPLDVPEVAFIYFDPEREEYVTETAASFQLDVAPNPEGQHRVVADGGMTGAAEVEIHAEGIRPNVPFHGALWPAGGAATLVVAAVALPALAYAAAAVWIFQRRRIAADVRGARARYARSRGRKRLAAVHHAADPAEALYKALIGFVADKAHVPEEGLTSADVDALLAPFGEAEARESIVKTLRACERARYGGVALTEQEVAALIESAAVNMDRLESLAAAAKEVRP